MSTEPGAGHFDVEERVKTYLAGQVLLDGDRELANYRFSTSHAESGVQISDVLVGLLGKFFSFIQKAGPSELVEWRGHLGPQQERNLSLLAQLLNRSLEENAAFAHYILSLEDQRRAGLFLQS